MASDRFGNNTVAPLYNATGRNPRDITPTSTGKPLGSVGSSGAGGYDYGISNRPPEQAKGIVNDVVNFFDPYNPYGPASPRNRRQSRRQSQSQPQGGGQPQGMSQTSSMSDDGTTQTNTLNNPSGSPINFNPSLTGLDFSVNKGAYAEGDIKDTTGATVANQYETNLDTKGSGPATPKGPSKPRGPYKEKTPERVAELKEKRAAKQPTNRKPRQPKNNPATPGGSDYPGGVTIFNGPAPKAKVVN